MNWKVNYFDGIGKYYTSEVFLNCTEEEAEIQAISLMPNICADYSIELN